MCLLGITLLFDFCCVWWCLFCEFGVLGFGISCVFCLRLYSRWLFGLDGWVLCWHLCGLSWVGWLFGCFGG